MEKWMNYYDMNRSEWRKQYFIELMKEITSTKEEKEESEIQIKEAIKKNNKKIGTLLNKDILLNTYPENIDLFLEYYQSLNYAYQGKRNFNEDKQTMSLIFAPLFASLSLKELHPYMLKFNLNFKEMNRMIVFYKNYITNDENYKKDLTKDKKNDISLIKQMIEEFIATDLNVLDFVRKYGITIESFKTYIKKIEEKNPILCKKAIEILSNTTNSKWKYRYNMKRNEWTYDYFKELIGGINSSKAEKAKCLKEIERAILQNQKGIPTEINKEILLKSYPESINVLKEYYDSLIYAHITASNSEYKIFNHYHLSHNRTWEDVLIQDRNTMLFIYAPYLLTLPLDSLREYASKFGLGIKNLKNMLIKYKKIYSINQPQNITSMKKNDLTVVKELVNDILVNGNTITSLKDKYKLTPSKWKKYMEQLKEIDIESYNQINEKLNNTTEKSLFPMKELIPLLYEYIVNGIQYNNKRIPFTMLDYYCLSKQNTQDIMDYIKNNQLDANVKPYKSRIINFFNNTKEVGPFVSAEKMSEKGISIICGERRVDFNTDFCAKMINYLMEKDIPNNYEIVYTAGRRVARGEEILPLLNQINNMQRKTSIQKKVKIKIEN